MNDILNEIEDYLEGRADADEVVGSVGPQPNEEMSLLIKLQSARTQGLKPCGWLNKRGEILSADQKARLIESGGIVAASIRTNFTIPLYTHPQPAEQQPSVPDEEVAKMFHESYEKLAPSFGYETREETRKDWERVPPNNKALMIAVIKQIRLALLTPSHKQQSEEAGVSALVEALEYLMETYPASRHLQDTCSTALAAQPQPTQQGSVPDKKPLPDLFMASYHEAIGWNACVDAMLARSPQPPQPEGDGWIKCSERLPTKADSDALGFVWTFNEFLGITALERHAFTEPPFYTHWKPTGLKRPQPPQEGSDDE